MEALVAIAASTLRVSTPLLFAALGGLVSERAGVINIALEGMMLIGAFSAAAVAHLTHSPWMGAAAGMLAGLIFGAFYGIFVVKFRANQIVAGTAINMLAAGVAPFVSKIVFDSTGSTPTLAMEDRFQSAPVWMAWGLALFFWFWLRFTTSGLWLQFAGEHPEALDSAGVRVKNVRWHAVLISGMLAGLGGASLSIFLSSSFSRNMTAGRGFMAVAALIFGKWRPIPTALACLFFGLADALQIRFQGVVLWGEEAVPVQFIQILPYLVTILVLAGFVGRSRAPRSLGIPLMVLLALGLSGCEGPTQVYDQIRNELKAAGIVMQGGRSPLATPSASPAPKPSANAELLREIYVVVFGSEPANGAVFGSYVDTLDQGASFEGVHNGFTHSADYRGLEESHPGASPAALRAFSEELAELEAELPVITVLDASSSKPLPLPVMPDGTQALLPDVAEPSPVPGSKLDRKEAAAKYQELFKDSSIFTLKRVLADEALKVLAAKRSTPGLPAWYGKWAVRLAGRGVDFGIQLRNRADEKFHADWVQSSSLASPGSTSDLLTWEILNRLHRVLNELNITEKKAEKK